MRLIVGLDVHKRETEACMMNEKGEVVGRKRFRTTSRSYKRVLGELEPANIVIENVGFHRPVAKWILAEGHKLEIANTRLIPKPRVKTDKKDAKHLADLHRANLLPTAWLPPEEVQRLRDVARQRMFLGEESARLKTKIRHDLYKHGHFVDENPVETVRGRAWITTLGIPELSSSLTIYETVLDEKKRFEGSLRTLTTNHPTATLLTSVPGIGSYTALLIVAEVGDFNRFDEADKLTKYAGLDVAQDQSGDNDKRGHITKEGNRVLRWALVEAAQNHVRDCPESLLSKRYARLAKKKGHGKAIVATARALGRALWTMVKKNEPFKLNPREA